MTKKQIIIIDGEKENCQILFECFHIDDSEAYKMLKKGIKITPENAPLDDFEFRLIANEYSVFGFSSICKRSKNSDEWEYEGFGHSGAASIVTALLKQLKRKEEECEELKNKYYSSTTEVKADICSYCDSKDTDRCDQTDIDELE